MGEQDLSIAPLNPPVTVVVPPVLDAVSPVNEQDTSIPVKDEPAVKPPHPLEPGGVRFQQIYARAKGAEEELDIERERRIRAEAERDLLKTVTPVGKTDHEYTHLELESMVAQGQATREQVDKYKEDRLEARLAKKLRDEWDGRTREVQRAERLAVEFSGYTNAIPNIGVQGTEERKAVDAEFDYLTQIHGVNPIKLTPTERQALALNAVRNVFGPVNSLKQRTMPAVGEIHAGSIGGIPPLTKPNPDQAILDGLKPEQVEHYNKMMRAGRYPKGWAEVVEELKYVPPKAMSGMVKR